MTTLSNDDELNACIKETHFSKFPKTAGKVRDLYDFGKRLLIVSTDRLSAFDRFITTIPYKGQVLNSISRFWFEQTRHLVKNHLIACPYDNSMMVKKLSVFPVEFIVRGYLTGSTNTSIWTLYQKGQRQFGEITLPDGMKKNDPLPHPILTPTSKDALHDKPLEKDEIIGLGLISEEDYLKTESTVLSLFDFASSLLIERDLILVDTKFELAKDSEGSLVLVDEVLTPDSSRYWRNSNYMSLHEKEDEPDNFDKERIRLWLNEHCNPYQDKDLPHIPDELRMELSKVYVDLYEMITGHPLDKGAPLFGAKPQLMAEI